MSLAPLLVVASTSPAWSGTEFNRERADLLEHIQQAPTDASGFAALAVWLFRNGDLTHALAAAEEAARLAPQVATHHRLAGYIHAASGAAAKAEDAFRQAAELDPTARVSLADFHVAQAWAEYQEALRNGSPDVALDERVRGLGAVAEISPELKALLSVSRKMGEPQPTEVVPPILLGEEVANAVVVEKHSQTVRLYGRRGGDLVLLQTYPCTTGQAAGAKQRRGDRRTPNGVYFVSDLLHGARLPDRYGVLALPLSYPNAWDRRLGRDGYGIWFHGSDRLGSPFTPRDTEGCVIMRNEDLLELATLIAPGITPVLIAEEVAYRPVAEWKAQAQALLHDIAAQHVLAMVAGPEYSIVMHRDDATVVHDFVTPGQRPQVIATEHAVRIPINEWSEKMATLLPADPVALLRVVVLDEQQPPHVVIETSAPAEVRAFRPELPDRLYLDLPGVRSAPMPTLVRGHGPWIHAVRVGAAQVDPPFTRVVIDSHNVTDYQVANEGNRIVVSLVTTKPR